MEEWLRVVYEKDRAPLRERLERARTGDSSICDMEYRLLNRAGEKVWVRCHGTVKQDKNGNPACLIGRISELTLGRTVDMLTGLFNADKFMEDIASHLETGEGYFMVVGIDDFKNINVKNGRSFGNYILKKVTDILEEAVEYPTRIYRMDGDRFGVHFPGKPKERVQKVYAEVRKNLDKDCTISAGAVSYSFREKIDGGMLYQYAETALDQAKKKGKDRLIFFSYADYQKGLEQLRLQDELKNAVQKGCRGFYLCFQPQIHSTDFEIYGAEALLRYRSESRGAVSPNEFIPVLEQTGLICPVGFWVLKTALHQCREWRKQIPDFHINVNISYVQLRQENIADTVLQLLQDAELPGDALTLEVTESIQLQDYSYYNKIFRKWNGHGIKVAIDDFGTGYSSLSYLKSLEIDETKIDRCFVSNIQYNAYNYRLLRNIVELARSARIQICCEGVETEEELMTLLELKPDILQGFLFAKPYSVEEFERIYILKNTREHGEQEQKKEKFLQLNVEEKKDFLQQLQKEELGNVVECFDDVVYVSDPDTYELYYMNAAGRKLTGIYDYRGCKCYEVLQGRDKPCEFCTNQKLEEQRFHIWERENTYLGSYFIIKDKLIPWQGKMARLELAINISAMRNEIFGYRSSEILDATNLGLWLIYIDPETRQGRMYGDKIMRRLLAVEENVTPEEYYLHWYSRINDGYYHYVNMAVDNIIHGGKIVQLEYTWNHPSRGELGIRCVGARVKDQDGMICMEGYHRIISDLERPYFMPDGQKNEMFEYNEKRHRIYFHTERKLLAGDAQKEEDFPERWIREEIVHPHFAETFKNLFENVQKNEEGIVWEMLLQNKQGVYEWFKVRIRHLGVMEEDLHTIMVLVDPAQQERAMELEYMRKSDFYEAMLSETAAYAEIDLESGRFMMTGGLWAEYGDQAVADKERFEERFKHHIDSVVHPEDVAEYEEHINMGNLKRMYDKGIRTQKYNFRRLIDGKMCWMELMIHIFQDRITGNMYALLYLKNVDAEKKKELAQENAAQRDPLTEVYNRVTFEKEVAKYMKQGDADGMLIFLDIDDFKKINDQYGHLQGDVTLKNLTEVLKHTFRSQDLIGRMGGDEFLVFVKGKLKREILNERLDSLFSMLAKHSHQQLTCSAGICVVDNRDFVYEEILKRADVALYESKKKGKNRYSYYEEKGSC